MFSLLHIDKAQLFSSALISGLLFMSMIIPTPQIKYIAEPAQVNTAIISEGTTIVESEVELHLKEDSTIEDLSIETIAESEPVPELVLLNVPAGHSFKSYTNYKLLKSDSPQGQLQKLAYSDENGLRKVGEYYCAALGSYYGTTIGDCYIVTLSSGNQFKITLCDAKDDNHTDLKHQYTKANGCITEFYVDYTCFNKKAKSAGNISVLAGFDGSIIKIEKLTGVNIFDLY